MSKGEYANKIRFENCKFSNMIRTVSKFYRLLKSYITLKNTNYILSHLQSKDICQNVLINLFGADIVFKTFVHLEFLLENRQY